MEVLVDVDVLLDFRGLQFCVSRTNEYLSSSQITDLFARPVGANARFSMLSTTLKPRINAYSLISALRSANKDVKLLSFIEAPLVTVANKLFPWLPPTALYVSLADCVSTVTALAPGLVLVHVPEVAEALQAAGIDAVCYPISKHQGTPLRSLLTPVRGITPTKLDEFRWWKSFFLLPVPIRLSGKVIHGFGKGSTELGFPTANINPEQTRVTAQLVPGVYSAFASLESCDAVFTAAVSIGWNPQFDNKEKTTEVHIINRFDEEFYGKKLTVRLVAYLRAETEFATVEELVQAIHFDVRLTQELLSHS